MVATRTGLEVEMEWARLFAEGAFVDPAALPGERVALRTRGVVAKLLPGPEVVVREELVRGPVLITDRRLVVLGPAPVDHRGVLGAEPVEWAFDWTDVRVAGVTPLLEGGVAVLPTEPAMAEGGRMWGLLAQGYVDTPRTSAAERLSGWRMWNRVCAGWYLAHDNLDAWRASTSKALA